MTGNENRTVAGHRPDANGCQRSGLALLLHALRSALLAAALLVTPFAQAAEIDWKQGKLGHLATHIGTYRYEKVLEDPAVANALDDLVGEAAAVLRANLEVAAPIDFSGGNLVLTGLAAHQGGAEEAMILIRLYDGTVRAALLHDGRMTLYARDARYSYVPKILRDFLKPRNSREAIPPDVIWVR
ncbi:MAG: hypothetical protein WDZ54_07190 [Sneathiella sp.]